MNIQKLIFLPITIFISLSSIAQLQTNSLEVLQLVSPQGNFNYQESDSVNFVIRIQNNGPNDLIAGDQFNITYSIANKNSTYAIDTNITVGSAMQVDQILQYTIARDITFSNSNNFVACATVNGTNLFPNNPNKFPTKCASFVVNIEKHRLPINKLYYASGKLTFSIEQKKNFRAEVFDITGRLLLSKTLNGNQQQELNFAPPSKGIYFLKVNDFNGGTSTKKFIIN